MTRLTKNWSHHPPFCGDEDSLKRFEDDTWWEFCDTSYKSFWPWVTLLETFFSTLPAWLRWWPLEMKVEKSKKFESNKNVSSMACRITTFDTVALIFVVVVVVVVTIIFTLNNWSVWAETSCVCDHDVWHCCTVSLSHSLATKSLQIKPYCCCYYYYLYFKQLVCVCGLTSCVCVLVRTCLRRGACVRTRLNNLSSTSSERRSSKTNACYVE